MWRGHISLVLFFPSVMYRTIMKIRNFGLEMSLKYHWKFSRPVCGNPDIVTEHCCQVCVLPKMLCRSDCRLCADMVSDCAIRKLLREPCGLTYLWQANVGYKNILHIWFSHFTLTETHWCKNHFMSLYFNKKGSRCWPRQSKPSLKLLDCSRKIQNDVHIDTYYRKRELTSWR